MINYHLFCKKVGSMKEELIKEKEILEFIKNNINDCLKSQKTIIDGQYHHNTKYDNVTSIINNGILSLNQLNDLGIINYNEEELQRLDDFSSHVNGRSGISLAKIDLTDLYSDEEEYDPYNPCVVDIILDGDIKASRNSINYGNEYIVKNNISSDHIEAIDIRILKYLQFINPEKDNEYNIKTLVNNYNYLNEIAQVLLNNNKGIYLREKSSNDNQIIDIEKLSNYPKLILKKCNNFSLY
jgi:hypothetical protein